jgi:hypothetical protein
VKLRKNENASLKSPLLGLIIFMSHEDQETRIDEHRTAHPKEDCSQIGLG